MAVGHWVQSIAGRGRVLGVSAGAFLVLAGLSHFGVATERARLESNLRAQVSEKAVKSVSRLDAELNANVFLANGMVAHVLAHAGIVDDTVQSALRALQQYGRHIRNIGIAPGNRISHVYPLEGNQAAIGLYYPDNPAQWVAVKRAIDTRATVLAGPVPLRQGGSGLICRTPVFLDDGRYWGVVSMVLNADELLEAVGLTDPANDIDFAIRGKDGLGAAGEVFFGDPALFAQDSVRIALAIPGGSWELAASPKQGWAVSPTRLLWLDISGFAASLLVAAVVYGYQRGRQRIDASERRLRAFLDTTRDAVIVIDDRGLVQEFNPAAEAMFGYKAGEMRGSSLNRLMSFAEAEIHDGHVASPQSGNTRYMAEGREVSGRRRTGDMFPIEVTVGEATVCGKRLHVGVVRDISERKAFERKLLELATTDGMTGALNRRAFVESAESAFSLAQRHGRPLSLLMFDADNFKQVNDTFGHHVGDAVLIELSRLAQDGLRATDLFGRLGGEEFGVLLPETSLERAGEVADRLIATTRQAAVQVDDGRAVRFTISIGVATMTAEVEDFDTLMRNADGALYQAKQSGRDRWCAVA